jgi:hypothetical protein
MDPFLLQQWHLHGSSTYLFRHRITSNTRSEVFANHVTTVAIPTTDKGSLQSNVFRGSKDYAARTILHFNSNTRKLFWRRAVSECVPLREKNNSKDPCFMFAGHKLVGPSSPMTGSRLESIANTSQGHNRNSEKYSILGGQSCNFQFTVLSKKGLSAKFSNYPGLQVFCESAISDSSDLGTSCR